MKLSSDTRWCVATKAAIRKAGISRLEKEAI